MPCISSEDSTSLEKASVTKRNTRGDRGSPWGLSTAHHSEVIVQELTFSMLALGAMPKSDGFKFGPRYLVQPIPYDTTSTVKRQCVLTHWRCTENLPAMNSWK